MTVSPQERSYQEEDNAVEPSPEAVSRQGSTSQAPGEGGDDEQHLRKSVRTPIACLACRKSKIKCRHNGAPPCRHCQQSKKQCIIPTIVQDDLPVRSSPQPVKRKSAVEGITSSFKRARYESGPRNLPCAEIMSDCLHLFSQHLWQDMFGFVHKPAFERAWREGQVEPCLCLAILTLTARLSRSVVKDFEDEHVASEYFCKKALGVLMPSIDKPSLPRIQALLMLGAYLWANSEGARAWIYIGIAIRMAQVLGLANAQAYPPTATTRGLEFIESETRRRTFWSCFLMDRLLSNGLGRPQMINIQDISIPLPQDNTRFLQEGLHPGEDRLPECTGTMAAYIELMDLWSHLSRWATSRAWRTDALPPWDEHGDFHKLQSRFDLWRDRLPSSLELNPQTLLIQLSQKHASFALMHMVYHNGLIFLHRSYLTFSPGHQDPKGPPEGTSRGWIEPPGFWRRSAHTCFYSAEQIIMLNRELVKAESPLCVPFALFSIFSACSAMAYLAAFPWMDNDISPRAQALYHEGLGYLESSKSKWKMVTSWVDTAKKLYDVHSRFSREGKLAYETTDHFADFRSRVLDYGTLHDSTISTSYERAASRGAYTSNVRSQIAPRGGPSNGGVNGQSGPGSVSGIATPRSDAAETPAAQSPVALHHRLPGGRDPLTHMQASSISPLSHPHQMYVANYVVPTASGREGSSYMSPLPYAQVASPVPTSGHHSHHDGHHSHPSNGSSHSIVSNANNNGGGGSSAATSGHYHHVHAHGHVQQPAYMDGSHHNPHASSAATPGGASHTSPAVAWGMQNLNQDSLLAFMLGNNAEVFGNDLQLEPLIGMSGW